MIHRNQTSNVVISFYTKSMLNGREIYM